MSTSCQRATFAPQHFAALFDHLVGAAEQHARHGQAERLRRGQIDDKVELGGLFNRKFTRLGPAQYLVDVLGCTPIEVWKICAVGHEAADFDELAERMDCW